MGLEYIFSDGDKAERSKVRTGQYGKKALVAAQGAARCLTGLRKDVGNVGDAVCGDTSLVTATAYDIPIGNDQGRLVLRGGRRKNRPDDGRRDAEHKGLMQGRSAHPTQRTHHNAPAQLTTPRRHVANVCLQSIQFCSPAPRLPAFVAKRSHFSLAGTLFGLVCSLPDERSKRRISALLTLSRSRASADQ